MKSIVLFLSISISSISFCQTTTTLEYNNVKARISDNGFYFKDQVNGNAAYEYPKDSNSFVGYGMTYWMGAKNFAGNLYLAANLFGLDGNSDFFAGPIAWDYNSTYYQTNFSNSIWEMSKSQIITHLLHYNNSNYVPDPAIINWPGNGDVNEGVAAQLAPYVDANNNQIYDPLNGDYPDILGDKAVFTIMNDAAGIHTESGGESMGIEVHSMFYQFASNDDLNNTTFLNVKVINRSTWQYQDFIYGVWMDPDIGQANNDFVGCDSSRNLGFGYNSNQYDDGQGGQNPYGYSPPAFGAVFLNNPMYKFVYFDIGAGQKGDPSNATDFYGYLNGNWKNGEPFLYGGDGFASGTTTAPTNFCFSGDPTSTSGWSEVSINNPGGDRRFTMSTYLGDLAPESTKCIDIAFVVNNDSANNLTNVSNLYATTDFIQNYFDNNISSCGPVVLSTEENKLELDVSIYPNPTSSTLNIACQSHFSYELVDLKGSIILTGKSNSNIAILDLNVEQGIYLIRIQSEGKNSTHKIIVE